jgi:hypothetical protein
VEGIRPVFWIVSGFLKDEGGGDFPLLISWISEGECSGFVYIHVSMCSLAVSALFSGPHTELARSV